MPNNINSVVQIVSEMRRGWPNGTDHLSKTIPGLLARIRELEDALEPFARVAISERSNPQWNENSLVHVRVKDCEAALSVTDPNQARPITKDTFFDNPA